MNNKMKSSDIIAQLELGIQEINALLEEAQQGKNHDQIQSLNYKKNAFRTQIQFFKSLNPPEEIILPNPKIPPSESISANMKLEKLPETILRLTTEGGHNNFLVLYLDKDKNYYFQLASAKGKKKIFVEAVGNRYLRAENKITKVKIELLLKYGWSPPNSDFYNYRIECPMKKKRLKKLIKKLRKTSKKIYGVPLSEELHYELNLE